jgi:hypothetical protein
MSNRPAIGPVRDDPDRSPRSLHRGTEPADPERHRRRRLNPRRRHRRSIAAIAQRLVIGEGAVAKHIANIFAKLDLSPSDSDNRRVRAVLIYLNR